MGYWEDEALRQYNLTGTISLGSNLHPRIKLSKFGYDVPSIVKFAEQSILQSLYLIGAQRIFGNMYKRLHDQVKIVRFLSA